VLKVEREGQQVRYRVHLASARAAPVMTLAFPPAAKIQSVQLESDGTAALPVSPQRLANGWMQLRLFSLASRGQDLSFDAPASAFELTLLDQSFGLPLEGLTLQRARQGVAVPWGDGDVTIAMRSYRLQP
jgi:hypothetical protein